MNQPEVIVLAPAAERQQRQSLWGVFNPDSTRENNCPQYTPWVELLVEFGVNFAFDDEHRLPDELPADLSHVRCIMLDRQRLDELSNGPQKDLIHKLRCEGVHFQIISPTPPHAADLHMIISRMISTAGLTVNNPALHDRLAAVDDSRLVDGALKLLPRQVEVLSNDDASWAWGDPMSFHIFWPAEEAANYYQNPQIMDPCWWALKRGLDPALWSGLLVHGKRYALKYAEHFKDNQVLRRVIDEVDTSPNHPHPIEWVYNGIRLGSDLKAPPGVDPTILPERVRQNMWIWPETGATLGEAAAYISRLTGDPQYAQAGVDHVLASDRWSFDAEHSLWRHIGLPDGPDKRSVCWGRGNGWMIYGVRGLLEDLPENHPGRAGLIDMLRRGLEGLLRYQTPSGLWYNVIPAAPGECRLDTSSAWMFINTYARAYWKGWLRDERIPEMCHKAWRGIKSRTWRGMPVSHCMGISHMRSPIGYYARYHGRFLPTALILPWVEIQRMNAVASGR